MLCERFKQHSNPSINVAAAALCLKPHITVETAAAQFQLTSQLTVSEITFLFALPFMEAHWCDLQGDIMIVS